MLIVVAFFALAWWPLQHLIGLPATAGSDSTDGKESTNGGDTADGSGAKFTVSAISSHPLKTLSLTHLGQPLLTVDKPDAGPEIEHVIEGVGIPPEGIELWVEAVLTSGPGENQRLAIRIELIPEDLEREPRTITLWGQPGESRFEAPAVFLWPNSSD